MTDIQQQDDRASAENNQQQLEQQEAELLATKALLETKAKNKRMVEAFSSE